MFCNALNIEQGKGIEKTWIFSLKLQAEAHQANEWVKVKNY